MEEFEIWWVVSTTSFVWDGNAVEDGLGLLERHGELGRFCGEGILKIGK
jgi:hypothetical protein